jgi:hypothetical protein
MVQELPPLEKYPKSHRVTFLYYWGILLFIDEDYDKAEKQLEEALHLCHKDSKKNIEYVST